MKHFWKRMLAGMLTVIMLASMMPPAVYAAVGELAGRSSVENAALLEALRQVYGDDAEAYLAVLEQYGLIDEDGNFVTDEKIIMDGVEYTLDEIEAILDDPDTDLDRVVEVDGQHLTLHDLKLIVEIEEYLAYIKATYFTQQDLTDEQIASFQDFARAFANGQVQLLAAGEELTGVGPAGVDHSVRASVEMASYSTVGDNTGGIRVTVTLNKPQTKDVTFSWRGLSGVLAVTGTTAGQGCIAAGDLTTSFTMRYNYRTGTTYCAKAESAVVVQLYDLTNALFEENNSSRLELSFSKDTTRSPGDTWFVKTTTDQWSYIPPWPPVSIQPKDYYYGEYYYSGNRLLAVGERQSAKSWGDPSLQNETGERIAWHGETSPDQFSTVAIPDGMYGGNNALCGVKLTVRLKQVEVRPGADFHGPPGGYNNIPAGANGRFFFDYNGGEIRDKKAEHPKVRVVVYDTKSNQELMNQTQEVDLASSNNITAPMGLSKEVFVKRSELGGWKVNVTSTVGKYSYHCTIYDVPNKFWVIPAMEINSASWTFREATTQTNATITAPAGEYYPGQSIPVTITYSYPQSIGTKATLMLNGEEVPRSKITGTRSTTFTYLYKVKETDGATLNLTSASFTATGANERKQTVTLNGGVQEGEAFPGVIIKTPDKTAAFADYQVEVGLVENTTQPLLMVTVPLNKSASRWVENELLSNDGTVSSLQVQLAEGMAADGQTTFTFTGNNDQDVTALVAAIPLNYNSATTDLEGAVDFLLDGKVLMGVGRGYTVGGSKPVAAESMTPKLTVTPDGGGAGTTYSPNNNPPLLYAEQGNGLSLSIGLTGSGYTWGDTTKLTADPNDTSAHFLWKSSNPAVATVRIDDKSASLVPTGQAGTTTITLTALNGTLPDAESAGINVEFAVGSDPFLLIPESGRTVAIREEQDALISWTSNLCTKNGAAGQLTTFHVRVTYQQEGEMTEFPLPAELATLTTEEPGRTISSVTIPWEGILRDIYNAGARSAAVEIWSEYGGEKYGTCYDEQQVKQSDTATAVIKMTAQPASVRLAEPAGGLYQTDGGSGKQITLTWTVPHLDTTETGGGRFELYIAGGGLDKPIVKTALNDSSDGLGEVTQNGETYSYTLNIPAVRPNNGPTSYRDSYSITVKAKNSAESTYAYDSYVLYVYSDSALRLLLDGAKAGDRLTMSNREKIAELWGDGGVSGSEAIVALQRDIALKNVISINYGEYAWAELADQIAWNSSDSAVATVNYQQGTLYENIENFSYTSYRPSTDFILSGLRDGSATVTAKHVKTGITDSVTVDVKTLRDQLYLFQCYPKAVTTLTYEVYTNANRTATEQMTIDTNANGEAAIYAPHGIAGDVYCMSKVTESNEMVTYLGTIYNRSLVSSEADSTKLQLYPVNTLRLRRAAQAEIYLKNPDGTPYQGPVTFRGGVYRQGEYCDLNTVRFGLQNRGRDQWKLGNEPQTVSTGPDGRLLVTMDLMQFQTGADQKDVQAGEKLYYLFQLEHGDGSGAQYYPLFLRVDAALNLEDIAASGDSIVAWETNDSNAKGPFIAQQTLKYSPSANANTADIRKSTGGVGPSATFPQAWVTTSVMWWGDAHAADEGRANSVLLQDTTGKAPDCQTSAVTTYPFTDMLFTENVMTLDNAAMNHWGIGSGGSRSMRAVLSEDGETASRTISLPFKIVNMIGVEKAEDSKNLPETMDDVKNSLTVNAGGKMDLGDKMIQSGMKLLASDAKYDPDESRDRFMVRLYATSDPTVFRALFCLSGGNMSSGHNVTGVYPEYGNTEDMTFVNVDSPDGGMKNSDKGLLPNPMNIYDMAKGRYMDKVNNEGQQAASGKGVRSFNMDLGGYFEADIAYNHDSGAWECRPITGGFHVGGGLNYTWNFNSVVGPVPVTASVTLGGTLEVRLDVQASRYVQVHNSAAGDDAVARGDEEAFNKVLAESRTSEQIGTDYLTSLRLFLYIRVFAGVGFDYSVVAFKIGVFGQLDIDLQFRWLNRNYLDPENTYRYSMVGPIKTRNDEVMFGSNASVSGSTGIEFVFKFLFISYEKIFCSVGFKAGQSIEDWETIEEIWAANKTINNKPVTRMTMPNGQVMYAVDLGAQLESRDYVDACEQVWLGGAPSVSLFSLDADQSAALADVLQTGAYSYANPVLSDDGNIMFYLSDRPAGGTDAQAKDLTNTRVAVSAKSDGKFPAGTRLDSGDGVDTGYGDSGVKVAGSNNSYAAVWVRQMENFALSSGDGGTLDEGQQMLQMNSAEIVAAISSDGSNWTLTRLTDNSTPDLAPVVATNGSRTVVAWREVSSTNAADLTSFDQQDAIRFRVYEDGAWGETQTLYDGTGSNASVRGIEAAMLSDGTAAVVYTLDTDSGNNSSTDWETVMAIIPASGAAAHAAESAESQDTVRTFRLTSDNSLDENPQITAVSFGSTERFVAAWHTERAVTDGGETESDIRLAAMNADGVLYENMPESLSMATGGTGDTIGSNFRFAKNAGSIDDLAILWADTVSGGADDPSIGTGAAAGYSNMGHDVLKAVKFVKNGSSYTLSGTVEVAAMADSTLIDHFDAYMADSGVKSVILGTNYSDTTEREVTVSDGEEDQVMTMAVANPVSGMYTASAEFTNRVEESAVMLEYEKLYPNSDIDVQFTIRSSGKAPVTKLEITAGNKTVYTSETLDGTAALNLLPNRDITVTAKFPTGETIKNVDYVIKAAFDGETVELPGTLYLDIPDVGISKVETIKEADGERTLRYSLYNALSAKLADTGDRWRVQVGFYADQGCTEPLKDANGHDLIRTITDTDDLSLIDSGGYSAEVTLPAASYVTAGEEIPSGGIPVYVKAWVEAPVKTRSIADSYDTVYEYYQGNNATSLHLDNLALRRNEDVTLQSTMDNSSATTSVTVDVQYNKLTGTQSGNLIVTLLDANGQPLEKLQSYNQQVGLLTLSKEGAAQQTFTFNQKGADVKVEFSNLILGENSVELDHISLTGAVVTYDPDIRTYTATGAGLTSGILNIAPKDPEKAKITFQGADYDTGEAHRIDLSYGTTEWKITVTNGGESREYTLVLKNTDPITPARPGSSSGTSTYPVTVTKPEHGKVTASPASASRGSTVTLTVTPDSGYVLDTLTVADSRGNEIKLTAQGVGKYTFTMPGGAVTVKAAFAPLLGEPCDGGADCPSRGFTDVGGVGTWYHEAVDYALRNNLMDGYGSGLFGPNHNLTRAQLAQLLYNQAGRPPVAGSSPFTDVANGAWYSDAVAWAAESGIVDGYGDGKFGPDDNVTREQLATILWRCSQSPAATNKELHFHDADKISGYALNAIRWAVENGILNGFGDGQLAPKGLATRAQVAQLLKNFIEDQEENT